MNIYYSDEKVKNQCLSVKSARKLFGGDEAMTVKLKSRIQALIAAETLDDIVVQKIFRFHKLQDIGRNKLEGYFAIDVKTSKEPWRIILRPLDENGDYYNPCNIDQIAKITRSVEIVEVSKHYE